MSSNSYNNDLEAILSVARGSSSSPHSYSSSAYSQYTSASDNPNNCTSSDWAPALPLDQYRLNEDPYPEIIRKKQQQAVNYTQNVSVRYLKPPAPAPGGDIVIKQLQDRQVAPAPALYVQRQQASAPTPAPLVIREAPPPAPAPLPGQIHYVPGKIIPPPARKVITEYLPPVPAKPQQIIIDRWLPYEQPIQRVRYEPAKPACIIPDPRNVVIQWDAPDVHVTQQFVNLGIHQADPAEYVAKYGSSLIHADQLPSVAIQFGSRAGHALAYNTPAHTQAILVGDVEYLRLIH
jgi:hypothetical protein